MLEISKKLLIKRDTRTKKSRTLFVPEDSESFWKHFTPKRMEGESFDSYKKRMKQQTGVLRYLNKRSIKRNGEAVLCGSPYSKYHS